MKKSTIALFVGLIILATPFDLGVVLNNLLGWRLHVLLYLGLVGFVVYLMPGRTLTQKWNNLLRKVRLNER